MSKKMMVQDYVKKGDFRRAIQIAKNFNRDLTKEENDIVTRAHEMQKNASFYEELGFNKEEQYEKAVEILKEKFTVEEEETG